MAIQQLMKLVVWVNPDESDDPDPAMPVRMIRRIAVIPLESIAYVQEGINRATTTIVLADGDVFLADENHEVIFNYWNRWYTQAQNTFVSFRSS